MKMQNYSSVDEYLRAFPKKTQTVLGQIRGVLKKAAPTGEEVIKYGIPTIRLDGKNLVHFAAYNDHIAFYPTPSGIKAFKKELKAHIGGKGTIRFSLEEDIPLDLIRRIAEYRVSESSKKNHGQKKAK